MMEVTMTEAQVWTLLIMGFVLAICGLAVMLAIFAGRGVGK